VTPYRVALIEEDTPAWKFTNTVVDLLFLMDIFIIFNSAYFDDDFKLIQNRKTICAQYLKGWFIIDAIAIFPFQIMMSGAGNYSDMVRITRIGRMYKLIKLTKLFRTLKMMKEKDKVLGYMQRYMSIGVGIQRLIVFTIVFFIMVHVISCLWIILASFHEDAKGTWMEGDINEFSPGAKYLTSVYWTITTITTVGYGDVSISTNGEKIFCLTLMLIGVTSFAYASGSLASILQS
jgi:hypothetical protein